jgi:hypothetical protein
MVMKNADLIRRTMSILGKKKSPIKAASSRRNGAKGGRPRGKRKVANG